MANNHGKGLFGRILRAFRSSCGADDDAWADLSPWDLCANSNSYGPEPASDIPRVVSIADEASDMVSDLHTINQFRGLAEQKSSSESEAELLEVFAYKTRRTKPESKHTRRDSPPSQDYVKCMHGLPSQHFHRDFQPNLAVLSAEQPRQLEKVVDDIPRNIYTQSRV